MITYTLKRKMFHSHGITNDEIAQTKKERGVNAIQALNILRQQKQEAGIGEEAYKKGDLSTFKGADLRKNKKGKTVPIKGARQSAAVKGQASTRFNKAYNVGLNTGQTQGFQQGQNSVGLMGGLKNTWNNTGTLGKAGMVAAGVGTAALAAKGVASMFGGRKRRKHEDDY